MESKQISLAELKTIVSEVLAQNAQQLTTDYNDNLSTMPTIKAMVIKLAAEYFTSKTDTKDKVTILKTLTELMLIESASKKSLSDLNKLIKEASDYHHSK